MCLYYMTYTTIQKIGVSKILFLILLFSKDAFNLSKFTVMTLLMYCNKGFYFNVQIKAFYFSKKYKNVLVSTKIFNSTTVLNIANNKKYLLSIKSAF